MYILYKNAKRMLQVHTNATIQKKKEKEIWRELYKKVSTVNMINKKANSRQEWLLQIKNIYLLPMLL